MYPDVDDPRFGQRLAQKKEFREAVKHLVPPPASSAHDDAEGQVPGFQPTSAQKVIRRFMSPATPYRAVLLFHMVGTGKTCTAIQVASQFLDGGRRVLVLAPRQLLSNFSKEVFNIDKDAQDQCVAPVGAAAARLTASATKRRNLRLYEAQRYVNADYELQSFPEFTNRMRALEADLPDGDPASQEVYRERVRRQYSGRVIVVDEVHHIRENEHVGKLLPPLLRDLVTMAEDVRLVLMSATPMFNRAEEIVDVLNLMHLVDRRPTLNEADVFDPRTGQLKGKAGAGALMAAATGYVSYADTRGSGSFPTRLWAKVSGVHRPQLDFVTRSKIAASDKRNDAAALPGLICSPMAAGGQQERWLLEHASLGSPMDVSATLQRCNIMYPGSDTGTLSSALRRVNQGQYAYMDRSDQFLAMPRLTQVAPKMAAIVRALTSHDDGIAFVYSFFLEHGLVPMAIALEHAGFVRADGPPIATGLSIGGAAKKGGGGAGGYVILAPEMSKNIAESIALINGPDNATGQRIRVVLGSSSVSEGVDLKCVRHVHVLEPWYNMNRIEQVIGRAVRRNSHAALSPKDRNVTVWLHATAFSSSSPSSKLESPDQHLYRTALAKQHVIQDVEAVLKAAAFDRLLLNDAVPGRSKQPAAGATNTSTFSARHVTDVLPLYTHLISRAMVAHRKANSKKGAGGAGGMTLEALKARLVDASASDPVDDETLYQVLSAMIADRTPVAATGEYIEFNPRTSLYTLVSPATSASEGDARASGLNPSVAWHLLKFPHVPQSSKVLPQHKSKRRS